MSEPKAGSTGTPDEKLESAVKAGLADVKGEIVKELRETLTGEEAERFAKWEKGLEDIRKQLNKLAVDDPDDPKAAKVVELEKKLDEYEAKQLALEEKLRLAKVGGQPAGGQRSEAEKDAEWGHVFLCEHKNEVRQFILTRDTMPHGTEKRSLDTSAFSTGGLLPASVADRFIDFIVDQRATLSRINTIRMLNPQGHVDELRVGTRSLRAGVEGTAPTAADSVSPKRRTLTTVEVIYPENITLTLLEDAIERAGTEGHIARLIATQFGNDSNDLAWNGDDSLSDAFLSINDGFFALFDADSGSDINDVDLSGLLTARAVFRALLQAMPHKFLGRTDHAYFAPVILAQNYADEVSARETQLGDQVLINGLPVLRYFGIPVIPETHIAAAAARAVLTPTSNLNFGIQRQFRVDSEWKPRERHVEYTMSARTDYQYSTGEAVCNGESIDSTLR